MAVSSPDRTAVGPVLTRAIVLGAGLGVIGVSGFSLLVDGGPGLLADSAALAITAVIALAAGLWAGAPAAAEEELPLRQRWATAGLSTALAGLLASATRIYGTQGSAAVWRTLELLVLIALPVYSVGLAIPPLLAAGERLEESLGEEEGGWGVLGAMALGLLAGVAGGVALAGLLLVPWLTAGPVLLGTSILFLVPLLIPEPEEGDAEEVVLREEVTPFSRLRVTEITSPGERQPERRLYLNGEEESAELIRSGAPALPYVAAAETWLTSTTPPGSAYLFLGGGAYTLPRRLAERDPRARITVVELDPGVTRIAQHFFGLRREHRIASVHGDARAYVAREAPGPRFDRVYVDVYSGDESLPYALVTRDAFLAIARHLRPGGVVGMNVIGVVAGGDSVRLWSVVRTFASVFPSVALYSHLGRDFPGRQNLLLAGAPEVDHHFPTRAGLFDQWPSEEWPGPAGTTVYRDLFPVTGLQDPPTGDARWTPPAASPLDLPLLQDREG
jgi:hypothetical protein